MREASLLTNAGTKGQLEKLGQLIHKFSNEYEDTRGSSNNTEPEQTEPATCNLKRMLQEGTISRSEVNCKTNKKSIARAIITGLVSTKAKTTHFKIKHTYLTNHQTSATMNRATATNKRTIERTKAYELKQKNST